MATVLDEDPDLEDLHVAEDERKVGRLSPFFAVYRTEARERRYGWYCSHCDCVRTVVDTMGRIECCDCENHHKARQWDAAYM